MQHCRDEPLNAYLYVVYADLGTPGDSFSVVNQEKRFVAQNVCLIRIRLTTPEIKWCNIENMQHVCGSKSLWRYTHTHNYIVKKKHRMQELF